MPSDTLFTNAWPFTLARSTRTSTPHRKAVIACARSFGSSPRSRAKWLRVPTGTQTKGSPCRDATAATTAIDPVPPATPSTPAPSATSASATSPRSPPGGDGSMAVVAAVASRHGLPFVCVPVGTRNHFALDLGLDPNDLAHAMTAFRRGVEVRVDLAEVNGQVFVNNVSLGIYAAMVRSRHYRRSKLHAVLDELPDLIGPGSVPLPLRFRAPDGTEHSCAHALLVSNNPYRLGGLGYSAWRPRLASGLLGVLTVRVDDGRAAARLALLELFGRGHLSPGYSRWSAAALTVDADGPVSAGLDGDPVTLESRLRFVSRREADD